MPLPPDVLLPANYKSFGFVDDKLNFNSYWDVTWSFTFALTGSEHGFCTFLTSTPDISSGIAGQYLGYLSGSGGYLLNEDGDFILTEGGERILMEDYAEYSRSGFISIAFDTTGFFALSNLFNSEGVLPSAVKKNSLIIRDGSDRIVLNESLSSLNTNFFMTSSYPNYQTIRIRFANGGTKLYVDYRKEDNDDYINLTNVGISSFDSGSIPNIYPAFSFCSPISSSVILPSTLFLKNFHVQGNVNNPTYE
jgi:hypothetical protein